MVTKGTRGELARKSSSGSRRSRSRRLNQRARRLKGEHLEKRHLLAVTIDNGLVPESPNYFAALVERGGYVEDLEFGGQEDTLYEYAAFLEVDGDVYALESLGTEPTLEAGTALSEVNLDLGDGESLTVSIRNYIPSGSGLLTSEYTFVASDGVDLRDAKFFQYADSDIFSTSDDVLTISGTIAGNSLNLKTIDPSTQIQSSQLLRRSLVGAEASGFAAMQYSSLRSEILSGGYDPPASGDIQLSPTTIEGIGTAYGPADITSAIAYSFTDSQNATIQTVFSNYDLVVTDEQFSVAQVSPQGTIDDGITNIQIVFTKDVDASTVDLSDFAFVGPNDVVEFTELQWNSPNHLSLLFDPLTEAGDYTLQVLPTIADVDGVLLNQDGDDSFGEPFEDRYYADFSWDTVFPYVFFTEPWIQTGTPVSSITLYFNEPIDESSVDTDDILEFNGPGGVDLRDQINSIEVVESTVEISFEPQAAAGEYSFLLSPQISDLSGNPMDQNQDGSAGTVADQFFFSFTASGVDLEIQDGSVVFDPSSALVGQPLTVDWTVENVGQETTPSGALWTDFVYVSQDAVWSLDDTLLGSFAYDSSVMGAVAQGELYEGTLTATLPGSITGDYWVIVRSNLVRETAEQDYGNNLGLSSSRVSIDVESLALGESKRPTVQFGDELLYRVVVPAANAGDALIVNFETDVAEAANALYVAKDRIPTASDYDAAYTTPLSSAAQVVWNQISPGEYFVVAATDNSASVRGNETIATVSAEAVSFAITDRDYGRGGVGGERTLAIHGVNLDASVDVLLRHTTSGAEVVASALQFVDAASMFATFDLSNAEIGLYDVEFEASGGRSDLVEQGLEVVANEPFQLVPTITAPEAFRRPRHDRQVGRTAYPFSVGWQNTGVADLPFVIYEVRSSEPFVTSREEVVAGAGVYSMRVWGTQGMESIPGRLAPGDSVTQTYYTVPNTRIDTPELTPVTYAVERLYSDPSIPMDWEAIESRVHSIVVDDSLAEEVLSQLQDAIGPTVGDYTRFLADRVTIHDGDRPFDEVQDSIHEREIMLTWAALTTSVVGKLTSANGDLPVGNRTVIASIDTGEQEFVATTFSDGSFIIPSMVSGTYRIDVDGVFETGAMSEYQIADGEQLSDVEIEISEGATVSGDVTAPDASADLTGLIVYAFGEDDNLQGWDETDESGQFLISGLTPDSNVRLTTMHVDYAPASVTVAVQSNAEQDILLSESGVIIGQLQGRDSFDDVTVFATNASDSSQFGTGVVFADGSFEISGLMAGTYSVSATDELGFAETMDVVVTNGQTVDTGTQVLSVESAARAEGELVGGSCTQNWTEASWWQVPQLTAAQAYLQTVMIPALTARFGYQDAWLYQTFITTDPDDPSPILNYGEGDQLVEGYAFFEQGFRHTPKMIEWLQLVSSYAEPYFESYFAGQDLCDFAGETITVDIREVMPDSVYNSPINFNDPFSIPGNVAGGAGGSDCFDDYRRIRGFFEVTVDCDGTIHIVPNLNVEVFDVIDFIPGDLGAGIEQIFTRPLAFLERYAWAYDVPFRVQFDANAEDFLDGKDEIVIQLEGCDPPDPCDDPVGYRQWLIDCGGGDAVTATSDCGSYDPNDIIGPTGYGEDGWIHENTSLDYMIRFENDAELATAPASLVTLTQQLDDSLDWSSFELGTISFGEYTIEGASGQSSYEARLDLVAELGIYIDVRAGIDVGTGLVHWGIEAIDPETGQLPFNPLRGFLPPNLDGQEGQGFVTYSVEPVQGFSTGTRIDAEAEIVFDFNEAINTPAIYNTYDIDVSTSSVDPLPDRVTPDFEVSWSGTDDPGAGIRTFDIYYREDDQDGMVDDAYQLWLDDTTDTSAIFSLGQSGHQYSFFSVATDGVGHVEEIPATPDAVTIVEDAATTISFVETSVSNAEGDAGDTSMSFVVSRTGDTTGITTVQYSVQGSGSNPANADDFASGVFPEGILEFSAGETSRTLTIQIQGDSAVEPSEHFVVSLHTPSENTQIVSGVAEGTIENDDRFDGDTQIFVPELVARPHRIPGANVPSAIIFQALGTTTVTVTSIGSVSLAESVQILDGDTVSIGSHFAGGTTAEVEDGGLYAIVFQPNASDRLYSVQSSGGAAMLSNSPTTNIFLPTDTNIDGRVTALDALVVINALQIQNNLASGEQALTFTNFMDVNLDGTFSPLDALHVINELAIRSESLQRGEGEQDDLTLMSVGGNAADRDSDSRTIVESIDLLLADPETESELVLDHVALLEMDLDSDESRTNSSGTSEQSHGAEFDLALLGEDDFLSS